MAALSVMFIAAFALLTGGPTGARAEEYKATELVQDCEAMLRLFSADGKTSDAQLAYDAAWCFAYLRGYHSGYDDGVWHGMTRSKGNRWTYCMPDGATVSQAARIIIRDAEKFPETLHEPASQFLNRSLVLAFPCDADAAESEADQSGDSR